MPAPVISFHPYSALVTKKLKELNQAQADVLKWINRGRPDGVFTENYDHRITARTLERRGLVTIKGQGPTWHAEVTTAGREWLADPPKLNKTPKSSDADHLMAEVLAAGGEVDKPKLSYKERDSLEKLISASLRSSLRPHGERLVLGHKGFWPHQTPVIRLEPYFEERVEPAPVLVPERIGKYRPAARAFLDDADSQYVTKDSLSRAARLLHAIAVEAGKRGIEIRTPKSTGQYRYERRKNHLILKSGGDAYTVTIKEIPARGSAKIDYSERYRSRRKVPAWQSFRTTEFIPTGKLELIIEGRYTAYGGKHIKDTTKIKLEDRLSELFAAFDKYQLEAEWQEEQSQLAAEEQERRRLLAIERATEKYYAQARWDHFAALVQRQEDTTRQRAFLTAAHERLSELDEPERSQTEKHLEQMRRQVDEGDPLATPSLLLPQIAEPSESDLEPFLKKRTWYDASY